MAQRTIQEIRDSITDQATSELGLINSVVAEWYILTETFVYAIWLFEGVMQVFQNHITNTVSQKQPPTSLWWYDQVLNFQKDSTLIVNDAGILGYQIVDEDLKIIAQALLTEDYESDPPFIIKVAKWDNEDEKTLQSLNVEEKQQFDDYLLAIHPPGVNYSAFSGEPDDVRYTINVEYDEKYTDIEQKVKDALDDYRASVNFTDKIYPEAMEAAVIAKPWCKNAYFTVLEGKEDTDDWSAATDILAAHEYTLVAGYFNFDTETINLL